MVPDRVLEFREVSKSYPIYDRPGDRLKELLTFQRRRYHRDYWALEDVSFNVYRGETFCVIGENGAGKSTLLQLVAGILQPSSGDAAVHGRVSALLELGAGFNPEFTGVDNIYLNGSILGFSRAEIDSKYQKIKNFAEIGDFIRQPVKTYSTGMVVRLAFAVAIHADPDVLLVDEALAVGDMYFRQRCMRRVHSLRENGTTILFVSHAMADVKALGDRTLWLEGGKVRELGPPDEVVSKYLAAMSEKDSAYLKLEGNRSTTNSSPVGTAPEIVETIPNIDHRHGDGRAEILGIAVADLNGTPIQLMEPDSTVVVRISVRAKDVISQPNVGFMLRNHLGMDFAGVNSTRDGLLLPPMKSGDVYTVDFHVDLPTLYPSHFSFSPAIADGSLVSYRMCDWIDNALTLPMGHGDGQVYGYMRLPCRVQLNARLLEPSEKTEV